MLAVARTEDSVMDESDAHIHEPAPQRMYQFLIDNRDELISRCRAKVSRRSPPSKPWRELDHGSPIFLDQLIKTLMAEQSADPVGGRKVSGPPGGGKPVLSEIGESATLHGRELMLQGFTVDEVVHDYGDVCQSISDLASEQGVTMEVEEFRTLNRCLDNAIANAVTEHSYQHDLAMAESQATTLNERLGFLAHELRNQLCMATLALSIIKEGNVGLTGATGGVLERALIGLGNLIDRSLAEVRITAGMPGQNRLLSLASFIDEVKISASLEANAKGCNLVVSEVSPSLAIDVDRDLLLAAVGNLLSNAFKFSRAGSDITLDAYAASGRILIDIRDECGGLPAGGADRLFMPFTQFGEDRSGLGLGLSISRRSVESNHGLLSVRDVPSTGCVFTIDLPRHLAIDPAQEPGTILFS